MQAPELPHQQPQQSPGQRHYLMLPSIAVQVFCPAAESAQSWAGSPWSSSAEPWTARPAASARQTGALRPPPAACPALEGWTPPHLHQQTPEGWTLPHLHHLQVPLQIGTLTMFPGAGPMRMVGACHSMWLLRLLQLATLLAALWVIVPSGPKCLPARCERRRAAQMSASLCCSKGSRLARIEPVNSTGTCMNRTLFFVLVKLIIVTDMHPAKGTSKHTVSCVWGQPAKPELWQPSRLAICPWWWATKAMRSLALTMMPQECL